MSTPFEKWIECPACKGTGHDGEWLDPDYGPPKCERCHGVGEIDPITLVPYGWAGIPPILGWQSRGRKPDQPTEGIQRSTDNAQ